MVTNTPAYMLCTRGIYMYIDTHHCTKGVYRYEGDGNMRMLPPLLMIYVQEQGTLAEHICD